MKDSDSSGTALRQEALTLIVDGYALPTSAPLGEEIKIQRVRQIDGGIKWSVRFRGECLNKDGKWEWEPMPSSRDDGFMARCRFDTLDKAIDAATTAKP